MSGALAKHDFPLRIERLFTEEGDDAFAHIHFLETEAVGDDFAPALAHPHNWRSESVALLAEEAAQQDIPAETKVIEENTTPSWLWRRVGEGAHQTREMSVAQIFNRVTGAATYAGWKHGIFADENSAQAFYDDIRYLLAQRMIALEPQALARIGLDWAYGIEASETKPDAPANAIAFESADFAKKKAFTPITIRNTSIDMLLGGNDTVQQKWQKLLAAGIKNGALSLRFADIAADWKAGSPDAPGLRAALDLYAFRREDGGGVDIDRLSHAAHLLTVWLELLGEKTGNIAISFHNLAPVLMAQGLPYDSEAGRTTAAALLALVSAEIYAASAHMAALLGPSIDFAANREAIMRHLRNHRRAAYGDRNDYEKVSVLPSPLILDDEADLAIIAAARHRWDDVLELVHHYGLRHANTDLNSVPQLAYFMESATQGMEPMRELTILKTDAEENFHRIIHPAVTEALLKLDYEDGERQTIIEHIKGAESLEHAAGIDHAILRKHGFDDEALEKLEGYLPHVTDIRLTFTPWILGEDFSREKLNLSAEQIKDPRFNLLRHLGFALKDIAAANLYCYGYGIAKGAKSLRANDAVVFALTNDINADALIRMAASLQSFISGDANLLITLPPGAEANECERLLLNVWRQGVKLVTIAFEPTGLPEQPMQTRETRAVKPKDVANYGAARRSALRSRPKAPSQLPGMKQAGKKSGEDRPSSKKR